MVTQTPMVHLHSISIHSRHSHSLTHDVFIRLHHSFRNLYMFGFYDKPKYRQQFLDVGLSLKVLVFVFFKW